MRTIHSLFIFIANDFNRIKRKWISLPLLFVSPLLFIFLLIVLLTQLMQFEERTLEVGIVNQDDSEETAVLVSSLSETSDISDSLRLIELDEREAEAAVSEDQLVSYIVFPEHFYQDMMDGQSSELRVTGNQNRQLESYLVSEVVDTIVRYIRSSQSNILTINHYAKSFDMDMEERHEMIFQHFINYFLQVVSSSNMMDEHEISPGIGQGSSYFLVSGLFITVTLWVLILSMVLSRDVNEQIEARMRLFGVTDFVKSVSKVLVTVVTVTVVSTAFLFLLTRLELFTLVPENFFRVMVLISLHVTVTALIVEVIDLVIPSMKIKFMAQIAAVILILFLAGAVIPTAYFPVYFTTLFDYIYSFQSLHWIENILLNGRYTYQLDILIITAAAACVCLAASALWKERFRR